MTPVRRRAVPAVANTRGQSHESVEPREQIAVCGVRRDRRGHTLHCVREPPAQGRTDSASLVVAARADAVYGAFADPAALMKWLPPGNMTGRALEYDFRQGGHYRIELTYGDDAPSAAGKTTGRTDVTAGQFLSLGPGKRIVQSVEFESTDAAFAGEMLLTWTFEPFATRTLVTITAENVPPGINKADHDAGLRSSLENLARYLETAA
jgi:uncharacterized protein YndB with AHSA1/START domain